MTLKKYKMKVTYHPPVKIFTTEIFAADSEQAKSIAQAEFKDKYKAGYMIVSVEETA